MSRRIEIELTSKRPDGTWTWRASGAREPRGEVIDSVVPAGSSVNDIMRADVETDLDGSRVLSISPPKAKNVRTGLLEILPSTRTFEPVTQQLAKRVRAAAMIVKVLVVNVKTVTSLVENVKMVTAHAEIAKKAQKVGLTALVVNSLTRRQSFHSVQRPNAFVHCATTLMLY